MLTTKEFSSWVKAAGKVGARSIREVVDQRGKERAITSKVRELRCMKWLTDHVASGCVSAKELQPLPSLAKGGKKQERGRNLPVPVSNGSKRETS